MRRTVAVVAAAALAAALLAAAPAPAQVPPPTGQNFEWVVNVPVASAASIDFFERESDDGTLTRYAAVGMMGYGVEFFDISDPELPVPVGRHVSPGVNYHTDVKIDHDDDILVMNVDFPGFSAAQGIGTGVEFVDISDPTSPSRLGVVPGLDGPHKLTLIGDHHVYTMLPTFIIDYADPTNPVNLGPPPGNEACGHDYTLDPSDPTIAYVAHCTAFKWLVVDVSDPANPEILHTQRDNGIRIPHQAVPAPDSSFVAIGDLGNDYTEVQCPGGGIHFYDISGRYTEPNVDGPAGPTNPIKMGTYFPPFTGVAQDTSSQGPYGSCTAHGYQVHPERFLISHAHYYAGAWMVDARGPTDGSGPYEEYSADPPGQGNGPTTWGNSLGNWLPAIDMSWYSKFAPFDDPAYGRIVYHVGPTRGLDVLRYTGDLPKKVADLSVSADAAGGVVTGTLKRFPVLTTDGWASVPLAGQTLEVTGGAQTATVTTADDGSFTADLGLSAGSHEVTVTWPGDDAFEPVTVTRSVTV